MSYIQDKLVEKSPASLSDEELLALVIGNERAAAEIMRDFGSFKGLDNQPLEKLLKYKGVGDATVIRLCASWEVSRRIVERVVRTLRD